MHVLVSYPKRFPILVDIKRDLVIMQLRKLAASICTSYSASVAKDMDI